MAKIPMINGQMYSWAVIKMNILGRSPVGIAAISYDDEREMEDVYGAGDEVIGRGTGNKKAVSSVTFYAEELEALQDIAPDGDITLIEEFPIVVSYLPRKGRKVTHVLQMCRFKKNGRSSSQGDLSIKTEIPIAVAKIQWKPQGVTIGG